MTEFEFLLLLLLIEILILTPVGLIICIDWFITKYDWCKKVTRKEKELTT